MRKSILKSHAPEFLLLLKGLDITIMALSGVFVHAWMYATVQLSADHRWFVVLAPILTLLIFSRCAVYQVWRGRPLLEEVKVLTGGSLVVAAAGLAVLTLFVGLKDAQHVRWAVASLVLGWGLLVGFRIVLRYVLRHLRSHGLNQRHVVLVCLSDLGAEVVNRLRSSPWSGLRVVGYFDDRTAHRGSGPAPDLPRLGGFDSLVSYLENKDIDQVWLSYPLRAERRAKELIHALRHTTVDIHLVLDIFAFNLLNHSMTEIEGIPVLNLTVSPMSGPARFIKAAEDRLIALLVLILVSPLMLLIAIGVKMSSPGPVFYRQERLSWNNRPFQMLKFRTMPVTAESKSGPIWSTPSDRRATGFGALLRRSSLDELPQFWNVLMGEMSIVGPRPERSVFVEKFKDQVPGYMKKHLVKGGITGWAQVNGWRGDTDLAKRIEHDLYYIENWSVWFDLRIVFLTLFRGFASRNAY